MSIEKAVEKASDASKRKGKWANKPEISRKLTGRKPESMSEALAKEVKKGDIERKKNAALWRPKKGGGGGGGGESGGKRSSPKSEDRRSQPKASGRRSSPKTGGRRSMPKTGIRDLTKLAVGGIVLANVAGSFPSGGGRISK